MAYFRRNDWVGRIRTDAGHCVFDSPANNAAAHYLHIMLYLLGATREGAAMPASVQAETYRANAIENCTFVAGEVRHVLPALMQEGVRASVVVADPPRAGFHPKALAALATLAPARIVYVSCNPSTLARDVGDLTRHGYRLQWVQPVDMFPQTPHIEAVARLSRA